MAKYFPKHDFLPITELTKKKRNKLRYNASIMSLFFII